MANVEARESQRARQQAFTNVGVRHPLCFSDTDHLAKFMDDIETAIECSCPERVDDQIDTVAAGQIQNHGFEVFGGSEHNALSTVFESARVLAGAADRANDVGSRLYRKLRAVKTDTPADSMNQNPVAAVNASDGVQHVVSRE